MPRSHRTSSSTNRVHIKTGTIWDHERNEEKDYSALAKVLDADSMELSLYEYRAFE